MTRRRGTFQGLLTGLWLIGVMCCAAVTATPAQRPASPPLLLSDYSDPANPDFSGPPVLPAWGDPASAAFVGPPRPIPFALMGQHIAAASIARLSWTASEGFAGASVESPVVVVHGSRPGPVLCLVAAVHGDELNGVEIVRRVSNTVDPVALVGTIIAVPIVNPFGFSRDSRYLPDRRDLNRYFPGTAYGSVASRVAHSFFGSIVEHCDYLVDFHTGSFERSNLPQIRADLRLPEVLAFTRGFGATPVLQSNGRRGMLRVAATAAGIPAVTFEVGAPRRLQADAISFGVQAIETLLHALGMTGNSPNWDTQQAVFYDSQWVRADSGGLLISEVALGDWVAAGQQLGRVVDPLNNRDEAIVSPIPGRVLGMALNPVVLPGFAAYHVGAETSAQQAAATDAGDESSDGSEDEDADATLENDPRSPTPGEAVGTDGPAPMMEDVSGIDD
ncbi:MAG: succinylglutamate desuccinylase/aspartoacylase family protein [Xanthomonadales bacterium]|nr:succinylglutamate desuccinylase/aspartoacylase family protein [Xanthomonadales bacterium]